LISKINNQSKIWLKFVRFVFIKTLKEIQAKNENYLPEEVISSKICFIREQKGMLDSDLAKLYAVENKQSKRQLRRNIERFPKDFMFELTQVEYEILRSQIGTLSWGEHSKYLPMAFTEQSNAMLSSVLSSTTALS
jgi:hypothetical protein